MADCLANFLLSRNLVHTREVDRWSIAVTISCQSLYLYVSATAYEIEILKKNKATKWTNVVDPYVKHLKDYDMETTPLILLLDEEKKILFKKIGADKLEVAIEQVELQKEEQNK